MSTNNGNHAYSNLFKNRKNLSQVLDVPFPSKKKVDFTIQIARASEVELRGPSLRLSTMVSEGKTDINVIEEMLAIIQRHAKGWDMDGVEYSDKDFKEFLDLLDEAGAVALVASYKGALAEDRLRCVGKSMGEASGTP